MKAVRGRDFTLYSGSSIDRASTSLEDEANGQECHKRMEQHDASLLSRDEFAKKYGTILVEVLYERLDLGT